jgi:hypothetical protein
MIAEDSQTKYFNIDDAISFSDTRRKSWQMEEFLKRTDSDYIPLCLNDNVIVEIKEEPKEIKDLVAPIEFDQINSYIALSKSEDDDLQYEDQEETIFNSDVIEYPILY